MKEISLTLPEKLAEVVKKDPNRIVLQIKQDIGFKQYSYQELYNNAQKIAQSLVDYGINQEDRIAIILENRPEWAFVYFGILFAGGVAVPLDPQSTLDDFKYFFANSAAKIVFTSKQLNKIVATAAQAITNPPKIIVIDEESSKHEKNATPSLTRKIKTSPDDIASLLYTSGTTGKPKGVILTHRNFLANFHSINQLRVFDSMQNVLSVLPLHHSFPFMVTLLIPIFSRGRITYLSSLKSEDILRCMQEAKVTVFVGVPQFFYLFYQNILLKLGALPFYVRWLLYGIINLGSELHRLTKLNLNKILLRKIHSSFGKNFKYFISGGAKLDNTVEIFLHKIGFTLIQGYGLTETAPIVTFNLPNKIKIGSVGTAIPDVQIKIIEPDPTGVGEVAIFGPNVMPGYYKREQETRDVLRDRWFYSGDLGYLDNEGYLFITGRKKELIILGSGKNISPEEVENHYLQSRYIKELCAFGYGSGTDEKLVAVIVPNFEHFKKSGEVDFHGLIKLELELLSQNYPKFKAIMGFVITKDDLPRTRLGKLKRFEIQKKYSTQFIGGKPTVEYQAELSQDDLGIIASPVYKNIVTTVAGEKQPEREIYLTDHLGLDLGLDSLARIELIALLEKQFGIKLSESVIANIATIKDLVISIDALVTPQSQKISNAQLAKTNIWQTILNEDPDPNLIARLDLMPSWLAKTVYILFCKIFYAIVKIFWRVTITGIGNLSQDKPFILCPNHTSYLDAFLILAALPNWLRKKIFFLGFHIYFASPIIRSLVKISRIIPLDPTTNLVDAMRTCSYVLKRDKVVCIFPEGSRSPDGSLQPFKKGVAILARELQIPVIPLYINGAFQALPRGKFLPKFKRISLVFGKPSLAALQDDYAAIAHGLELTMHSLQSSIQD